MCRKIIALAAFAVIPLLGACTDPLGLDFSNLGNALGEGFCWDMSHGCDR